MFAVPNLRGIGSEEDGRRGDECAVDNGVIDRDVMAFKTPTPGGVTAGRAKDDEVVEIRVAGTAVWDLLLRRGWVPD